MIKTIERAHSPRNLWEKIPLNRNYQRALAQIDKHLIYWPKFLVHKNKQRLTKIHQYLIRMRKLVNKIRPVMVSIKKKVDRRELKREAKALKRAKLTNAIEEELLERLKSGLYDKLDEKQDVLNFPQQAFDKTVEGLADREGSVQLEPDLVEADEKEGKIINQEVELEVELEKEKEEEKEEELEKEFVADFEPDEDDIEEIAFREEFGEDVEGGSRGKKRKTREIEYEKEFERIDLPQTESEYS